MDCSRRWQTPWRRRGGGRSADGGLLHEIKPARRRRCSQGKDQDSRKTTSPEAPCFFSTRRPCPCPSKTGCSALDTPSGALGLDLSALGETPGALDWKSSAPGETSGELDLKSGALGETSGGLDSRSGRLPSNPSRLVLNPSRPVFSFTPLDRTSRAPGSSLGRPGLDSSAPDSSFTRPELDSGALDSSFTPID